MTDDPKPPSVEVEEAPNLSSITVYGMAPLVAADLEDAPEAIAAKDTQSPAGKNSNRLIRWLKQIFGG